MAGPSAGGSGGDVIQVRGLRVVGTHGVLAEEQVRAQPFELDLDLAVDLGPAGASDDLADTVDYGAVAEAVAALVAGPRSFALLEALADEAARTVLGLDPRIGAVTIAVRKLRPPLPVDVATVGVTVTRTR
jgi:dihydroneopterin aldolase